MDTIVTDNGTQFTSQEFQRFCIQHQIKHLTSPVFHPASNGEAERFVQTFKKGLNKNCEEGRDLIGAIRVVLASYRTSIHPCLNWHTPAEVLHGRQPKCLLSLFLSHEKQSSCLKFQNDSIKAQFKSKFDVGSLVYALNYAAGPKWLPGRVIKKLGNVMFNIRTERGVWRRHHNQLQPRVEDIILNDNVPSHSDLNSTPSPNHNNDNSNDQPNTSNSSIPSRRRYPLRIRKPSDFYQAS